MKTAIKIVMIGIILSTMSGCVCSYMSYKSSEKEILRERIIASGDQDAIKNLNMGVSPKNIIEAVALNRGVGLKINIRPGMGEILSQNGLRQAGSALLDAGMIYALAELANSGGDESHSTNYDYSSTTTVNGDDNVVIDGNDNDSNGDDDGVVTGDNNTSNNDKEGA